MKKIITILLAAALSLSLAACGGSGNGSTPDGGSNELTSTPEMQEPDDNLYWSMVSAVDDFGDETGSQQIVGSFTGDFSNTATSSSQLDVAVIYALTSRGDELVGFRLFEYGNTKATFTTNESDKITLRTRALGVDNTYNLYGDAPNSDIMFASSAQNQNTAFVEWLNIEADIDCIIDIGSSSYNFTINTNGFAEQYNELQALYQAAEEKMLEEKYSGQATVSGRVGAVKPVSVDYILLIVDESDSDILEISKPIAVSFLDSAVVFNLSSGDPVTVSGPLYARDSNVKVTDGTNTYGISAAYDMIGAQLIE